MLRLGDFMRYASCDSIQNSSILVSRWHTRGSDRTMIEWFATRAAAVFYYFIHGTSNPLNL